MAKLRDPAIKLFGRTIAAVPPPPMPTPAAAAAVASDQVEPPEESPEVEKIPEEEPPQRRNIMQDHISSFIDSPPHIDSPIFGFDLLRPPQHLHHMRAYH
ncbi:hypothetical protein ACMD2_13983 [Ananas comosus]|uniref:Uncharacterized protein n=1 Tax=Ananas comosus TaxID=4615 RepID=A0A199V0T4_ANACO|nr:hypothetical protein ACMD2_13983 [Ananas comosus]